MIELVLLKSGARHRNQEVGVVVLRSVPLHHEQDCSCVPEGILSYPQMQQLADAVCALQKSGEIDGMEWRR